MISLLDAQPSPVATGGELVLGLLAWIGIGVAYFVPAIVAYHRHTINAGGVLVLNLLLGWTCIGWIIALVMAAGGDTRDRIHAVAPPPPSARPQYSPDGNYYWNGRAWLPVGVPPPPPPSLPSQ